MEHLTDLVSMIDDIKDKINDEEYRTLMEKSKKIFKKKEDEEFYKITYMELKPIRDIDELCNMNDGMGYDGGADWEYKTKICKIDNEMINTENPQYCKKRLLIEENGGKMRERYFFKDDYIKFDCCSYNKMLMLPCYDKLEKKFKDIIDRKGVNEDDISDNVLCIPHIIILKCEKY
jgi:hypothetical protein